MGLLQHMIHHLLLQHMSDLLQYMTLLFSTNMYTVNFQNFQQNIIFHTTLFEPTMLIKKEQKQPKMSFHWTTTHIYIFIRFSKRMIFLGFSIFFNKQETTNTLTSLFNFLNYRMSSWSWTQTKFKTIFSTVFLFTNLKKIQKKRLILL